MPCQYRSSSGSAAAAAIEGGPQRSHALVDVGAVLDRQRQGALARVCRQRLSHPRTLGYGRRVQLTRRRRLHQLAEQQPLGPERVVERLHRDLRFARDLFHRGRGVPDAHEQLARTVEHPRSRLPRPLGPGGPLPLLGPWHRIDVIVSYTSGSSSESTGGSSSSGSWRPEVREATMSPQSSFRSHREPHARAGRRGVRPRRPVHPGLPARPSTTRCGVIPSTEAPTWPCPSCW